MLPQQVLVSSAFYIKWVSYGEEPDKEEEREEHLTAEDNFNGKETEKYVRTSYK